MFDKKIDFKKLHIDLSETYKQQMKIKKEFPHRYEEPCYFWPMSEEQRAAYKAERLARAPWKKAREYFDSLSEQMTSMCCLLALAGGRQHIKKRRVAVFDDHGVMMGHTVEEVPLEGQWEFVREGDLRYYTIEEPEESVVEEDEQLVDAFIKERTASPQCKIGWKERTVEIGWREKLAGLFK